MFLFLVPLNIKFKVTSIIILWNFLYQDFIMRIKKYLEKAMVLSPESRYMLTVEQAWERFSVMADLE